MATERRMLIASPRGELVDIYLSNAARRKVVPHVVVS
jgi:hypothetical protein